MLNQSLIQQGIDLLERGDDLHQAREIAKLRALFALSVNALSQIASGDLPATHARDILEIMRK